MTEMNLVREDWAAVLRLLDTAFDLPQQARARWLGGLAPEYQHLKPALQRLLNDRAAIETADFLNALPKLSGAATPGLGLVAGQRIGPYELLRELGRGGMATVWLAERADGAHRRDVALKLPYLGARAQLIGERFARERDILSALAHPHIASVLDAGTDGVQPWLAMEYIHGQPLTAWAQQQALDVPTRLRLFLQVLQAVQYAHAQLVIHRDLKPSNVLVDVHDKVKLLDFGVAKLLDNAGVAAETELTQVGGRALTPNYASPEQIAGKSLGTASDVYSLGVLLYELLTERLPYTLKRATHAALEEAILHAQIARPSAAVGHQSAERALRGDVDTIVLKALALKPEDRYSSAETFAQDIERHLQSLPILARPPSVGYRLQKLLVRNRVAVVASTAVAVALIVGAGAALWQATLARRETQRAEAVQQFLATTLSLNEPDQSRGRDLSAREMLDLSAKQIDTQFADDLATRAQLHHTVGGIYIEMGELEAAVPHMDQAVALYETSGQRGTKRHIEALFNQVEVLDELADFKAARKAAFRAQHEAQRAFGANNPWSGRLLAELAWVDLHQGRVVSAKELGEQALAQQARLTGEKSLDYIAVAVSLAHVYLDTDDIQRATKLFEQGQKLGSKLAGYSDGDRLMDRYNLARTRFIMGNYASVEAELRDQVPRMEKHFGPAHDRAIISRSLLAQTLAHQGHFDEAVAMQQALLAAVAKRNIPDDEAVQQQRLVLALVLNIAGRYDEALTQVRQGMVYFEAKYSEPTSYRERGRWILAEALLGLGYQAEGVATLETALANVERLNPEGHHLAEASIILSLAVAERRANSLPLVCESAESSTGIASRSSLRCRAVEAWLNALALPSDQRGAASLRFIAAREKLFDVLPSMNGLRPELLVAEAEIVQAIDAPRAQALKIQADIEYRRVFGRTMPARLLVLH
jgi:eukaryotic-like serine/threonine-protein kinase